jgi:hypothetical protein
MKRGLDQAALPKMLLTLAGEQAFAEQDSRALQGAALDEIGLSCNQNLSHQVGMVQ